MPVLWICNRNASIFKARPVVPATALSATVDIQPMLDTCALYFADTVTGVVDVDVLEVVVVVVAVAVVVVVVVVVVGGAVVVVVGAVVVVVVVVVGAVVVVVVDGAVVVVVDVGEPGGKTTPGFLNNRTCSDSTASPRPVVPAVAPAFTQASQPNDETCARYCRVKY